MATARRVAPQRTLVTNDDGVTAPGLRWLAGAALESGMDVMIAAPGHEASGASAALSASYPDRRLGITKINVGLDMIAYSVEASPSYIVVLAALGAFGPRPDVILSGINRGANAGHAVLHSGTVGAALTAANHGINAMAVSLDVLPEGAGNPATGGASLADYLDSPDDLGLHWATATEIARRLLPRLSDLPERVMLNVNVPNRPVAELAGLRQASLAPFGQVQMSIAESGEGYVRTAIERAGDRGQAGTDLHLLAEGFATVTPVSSVRAVDTDLGL
jgi:5'-nucleotidase